MIRFENAHIGYDHDLIEAIDFELPNSGIIGLFGKNGTGKSTLFKTIIGLQALRRGNIFIHHQNISEIPGKLLAKKVSYCPTQILSYGNLTVWDVVSNGRIPHLSWLGKLKTHDIELVENSLELMGISDIKQQLISECSDGQKQKAIIASALAQETSILLLDEPTAFLDYPSKQELLKQLSFISEAGKLIIVSSHDLDLFEELCDLKLLLSHHKIITSEDTDFNKYWDEFTTKGLAK